MKTSLLKQLLNEGQIWLAQGSHALAPCGHQTCASFTVPAIDELRALSFGSVHEWSLANELECKSKNIWYPPSFITSAVLGSTLRSSRILQQKSLVVWIGKKIWPTPFLLQRTLTVKDWSWRSHGMFLDPKDKEERLWSIIQFLHSPGVFAVFADGSGLNFIATRRLQLAAQKNNALCFLLRPPWELERNSSAHSKWKIITLADTQHGEDNDERWHIELVSGKGILTPLAWDLQWTENEQGGLHLVEKSLPIVRERELARQA